MSDDLKQETLIVEANIKGLNRAMKSTHHRQNQKYHTTSGHFVVTKASMFDFCQK